MALPIINLSLVPIFPSKVAASAPLKVTKTGATYTFSFDPFTYSIDPAPVPGQSQVLVLDTTTNATSRVALGVFQAGFSITSSQITDSTAIGRSVLTGDASAGRGALGLGPISTLNIGSGLSSAAGSLLVSATGVSAGSYSNPTLTIGADGRVTAATAGVSSLPRSYLSGLRLANNATDATNDIDIAAGVCRSTSDTASLSLNATNVKQIDVAFAEYTAIGTASGGRDSTDNLTGAKWFNVYLIGGAGKNDQGFFSTSASPTLPSGFTYSRRIGSVYWASSAIKPFTQVGDTVHWTTPTLDANTAALSTTTTAFTLTTPTGLKCMAMLNIAIGSATAAVRVYLHSPDNADDAASATAAPISTGWVVVTSANSTSQAMVMTGTTSNVRAVATAASTTLAIATLGYIDRRGRDD